MPTVKELKNEVLLVEQCENRSPCVWSFYPTKEQAQHALDCGILTGKFKDESTYSIMSLDEYLEVEKAYWITGKVHEISESEWWDMFECLPPLKYGSKNGITYFLMSEMTCGSYTGQFVKLDNGECYSLTVDSLDRSTWCEGTRGDFNHE